MAVSYTHLDVYKRQDPDYITLQRARERMTAKDKNRMMGILKIGFDYAFSNEEKSDGKKSVLLDNE